MEGLPLFAYSREFWEKRILCKTPGRIPLSERGSDMAKTIAAISTGAAPGGIGIVRISGEAAREIADRVFRSKSGRKIKDAKGYTALLGGVFTPQGEKLDDVVALVFSAPKSYTGEDVVELSCHGGLYITRRILREVLEAGAFSAQPGEFTRRAFLHGKMDLAQAEAVMELISAEGEQAARAALAGSTGVLSQKISGLRDELSQLAAHLTAWIDFPEEGIPELEEEKLFSSLKNLETALEEMLRSFDQGTSLRKGVETVIAGRPNVGKSTLMNLLSGHERSIVTEYAGTTRDIVENTVTLGGVPLLLADTAGLRETEDPVEKIGVTAARERMKTAQLVLAVFDSNQELTEEEWQWARELDPARTVAVINKTDLPALWEAERIREIFPHTVQLSAASGEGLKELEQQVSLLLHTATFRPAEGVLFTERQRENTAQALKALQEAREALSLGLTLDAVSVCVEDALGSLYALTGEKASDEIIDRVFEEFCVGK